MAALGKTLRSFKAAFAELGVRWYLFGAQAASYYGVQRATFDVDVTIEIGSLSRKAVADAVTGHGFTLRFPDPSFTAKTRVLPVTHTATGMLADVVFGGGGLDDLILARAKRRRIDGIVVPIAAAEDIVVMKILAQRGKDVSDVVAMLRSERTNIDAERVLAVLGQLEVALDQSDLVRAFESMLKQARPRRPPARRR